MIIKGLQFEEFLNSLEELAYFEFYLELNKEEIKERFEKYNFW